jgi:hypothetical protein
MKHSANLVVAPATLLENWRREFARFGPNLDVLIHSGSQRTGLPEQLRSHDVVIASFETAVPDVSLFRNVRWNLLILDEAQGIKNPTAKRSIQLKTIPRNIGIAVTGTPVETVGTSRPRWPKLSSICRKTFTKRSSGPRLQPRQNRPYPRPATSNPTPTRFTMIKSPSAKATS